VGDIFRLGLGYRDYVTPAATTTSCSTRRMRSKNQMIRQAAGYIRGLHRTVTQASVSDRSC
jgi:hypothetical protein